MTDISSPGEQLMKRVNENSLFTLADMSGVRIHTKVILTVVLFSIFLEIPTRNTGNRRKRKHLQIQLRNLSFTFVM